MSRSGTQVVYASILFATLQASALADLQNHPVPVVNLSLNARVPMRDGVRLSADIFRAEGQQSPLPCIAYMTPYTADKGQNVGRSLVENGYVFASVDVRGRGDSEGNFLAMEQEGKDGYDLVEWLARQSYCNGKIGMLGGSYQGYDQWATAKELPPHLVSIVPVASVHPGVDYPYDHNIAYPYQMQWLAYTEGHTERVKLFDDFHFWADKYRELYRGQRPFAEFDAALGMRSTIFHEWVSHPAVDSYWDSMNPTAQDFSNMRCSILTITGQYDDDQAGAISYYRDHQRFAKTQDALKHHLIIGPWDHAGTRYPKDVVGGLRVGAASLLDVNKLRNDWFDWTMKSGEKPTFLKARVAYYFFGEDIGEWRYAQTLDDVTSQRETFFLASSDSNPTSVFNSGTLSASVTSRRTQDFYEYDPNDPETLNRIDSEEYADWALDQRWLNAEQGRYLVYQTGPLKEPIDIAGFFKLSAWIVLDRPDTDFHVELFEVTKEGKNILLSQDSLRARYRVSPDAEKMVPKNVPQQYVFDRFTFVARRLSNGSRLRLAISPPPISPVANYYPQKNFNSGGVVANETSLDAKPVRATLLHDANHRSFLEIPIAKP
jgi:uncharacterized protein